MIKTSCLAGKNKSSNAGIEPRFARRSVPKKEMKANRDSHYTTSDYLLIWNRLAFYTGCIITAF